MIAEITALPIGESEHMSKPVASIVKRIAASGLDHEVTAMGTLVEGDDDAIWSLLRDCHDVARKGSDRVIFEVRIDAARRERRLGDAADRVRDALNEG